MDIEETKNRLAAARNLQRIIRKEIDELRKTLNDAGVDPDPPKVNLIPRNKKIYKACKKGYSYTEIAKAFGLSLTRVTSICHRIDRILEKKAGPFEKYKSLLKYR